MSSLSGVSIQGASIGSCGRSAGFGWFDWSFIDVTGAGDPLSTGSVQVPEGQADFGNCKESEDAVYSGGYQGTYAKKLIGCRDRYTGSTRYFGDYATDNQCPPGQFPNGPGGACVSNFCELGYQPAPGGGCEPVKSGTTTPSKPPATSGGGGGYKAPATPATVAPPPPVESSFPWKWALAGLLAVSAVGVVVAKKKGYLKNAEEDEDC